jgi:hypothetical protein
VEIVVPAKKESENRRMAWAVAPLCTVSGRDENCCNKLLLL